jgi:monoamine oxidase
VLPDDVRERAAAAEHVGFGNVIKVLLRFKTRCWPISDRNFATSCFCFLMRIPVWWTQFPDERPVLTGWFGGPKTEAMSHLDKDQLIEVSVASLAEIFGLPPEQLKQNLVASRAINWRNDPFARGAYSYATLGTRHAQARKYGRKRSSLFRRGTLSRERHGHCRGSTVQWPGDGAAHSGA